MSPSPLKFSSSTGVPAKAGTHFSTAGAVEGWVPVFAGTPIF